MKIYFPLKIKHFPFLAKNSPDNEKIIAAMADLYLRMGDKSNCEAKALSLLKINPNNAYASYILSEILLQNDEENKALGQFQKILDEHPDNFSILSKLIEFFKKTGKLDDAKVYIEKSEARAPNKNDPGLCYCRGIYSKYNRNPQEAIRELTKAKRSTLFKVIYI